MAISMGSPQLINGVPLLQSGAPAVDPACCCEPPFDLCVDCASSWPNRIRVSGVKYNSFCASPPVTQDFYQPCIGEWLNDHVFELTLCSCEQVSASQWLVHLHSGGLSDVWGLCSTNQLFPCSGNNDNDYVHVVLLFTKTATGWTVNVQTEMVLSPWTADGWTDARCQTEVDIEVSEHGCGALLGPYPCTSAPPRWCTLYGIYDYSDVVFELFRA
jgi:hypothetical protein